MTTTTLNRFNQLLGIQVRETNESGCTAVLETQPDFENSLEGIIHGGVTYTLADVAMGHGAVAVVEGIQQCVTVECKINYLQPARGRFLTAQSQVLKKGNKIITMEAKIWDEQGELVAVALGTYVRIRPKG